VDEYVRIGETTANESLQRFCRSVIEVFGEEYLRAPTEADLLRLHAENQKRGFPGMVGSLDCCHWEWKNCPAGWHGAYQNRKGTRSIILEAVASYDLWCWHAAVGIAGSNNDLNVLDRSPLWMSWARGERPTLQFVMNNRLYEYGYYLCDGIYPDWSILVKSIPLPQTPEHQLFAKTHEAVRKDVERLFGVLMARFAILRNPARYFFLGFLKDVWTACIILHNLIIESDRGSEWADQQYAQVVESKDDEKVDGLYDGRVDTAPAAQLHLGPISMEQHQARFLQNIKHLKNQKLSRELQQDLVQHQWQRHQVGQHHFAN